MERLDDFASKDPDTYEREPFGTLLAAFLLEHPEELNAILADLDGEIVVDLGASRGKWHAQSSPPSFAAWSSRREDRPRVVAWVQAHSVALRLLASTDARRAEQRRALLSSAFTVSDRLSSVWSGALRVTELYEVLFREELSRKERDAVTDLVDRFTVAMVGRPDLEATWQGTAQSFGQRCVATSESVAVSSDDEETATLLAFFFDEALSVVRQRGQSVVGKELLAHYESLRGQSQEPARGRHEPLRGRR